MIKFGNYINSTFGFDLDELQEIARFLPERKSIEVLELRDDLPIIVFGAFSLTNINGFIYVVNRGINTQAPDGLRMTISVKEFTERQRPYKIIFFRRSSSSFRFINEMSKRGRIISQTTFNRLEKNGSIKEFKSNIWELYD